ncbi:LysR family transcriptional regulator substrate-binding protein [Brevibacillus nitrificans]|uniref:LysR family transcriptional regulator substrate-binding protein n=2 Tax=Brevibacillus nitrificans TaxID=651560 RepID=UPI00399C838A
MSSHTGDTSTDPEVIYGLVKAGLGHALIPSYWKAETRMESLVYLPIDQPSCHRTIGLSWVENRLMPIATRHFRVFVIHNFSTQKTSPLS